MTPEQRAALQKAIGSALPMYPDQRDKIVEAVCPVVQELNASRIAELEGLLSELQKCNLCATCKGKITAALAAKENER